MYIILKGRVVFERKSKDLDDMPIVEMLLADGENFGTPCCETQLDEDDPKRLR